MIKIIFIIILGFVMYNIKSKTLNNDVLKETKENFNLNCKFNNQDNAVKDYDSRFFEKKSLLDLHLKDVNSKKIPENIYTSNTLIPFNYKDNLDNNIVYNLNIKKKDSVLKNEKKYYGKIQPFNQRILTNNFNYNLDSYNEDQYYTKYDKTCVSHKILKNKICSSKDFEIKLFGNYLKNKLHLYWNLPSICIDIKNIVLFYKESNNDEDYDVIDINYSEESKTKKYKNLGKLEIYFNNNRLNYNFFFKFDTKYDAFIYVKFSNDKEIVSNIYKEKN